ncbi:copper resistance CopC family protein [Actinokineospora inagensis]|uniref:copper resistance CopC family protein n=1 Tax=Actinokineospora inagensis TaxID=103730 RepID=UPI00041B3EEF|nr:copper resistance CopC family protein [Actinokineospora inagensis]
MSLRRLAATLLVAGALVLGTALPALAHAELESTDPAKGASVTQLPKNITLTFSDTVLADADGFAVTGPGGARWTIGNPTVAGGVVTVPVTPVGPVGEYLLEYRVTADDGDHVSGGINFTMAVAGAAPTTTTTEAAPSTTAPTQAPVAAPASEDSKGVPSWVWFVVGLAVVVIIVVLLLARMRRGAK